MTLTDRDVLLSAFAAIVLVWTVGLVVYTVVSDARQTRAALNAITASFTEELRRAKISP